MSDAGPGMPGAERERIIFRTGLTGILANLLLSAFKAAVGLLSHSIAVVLDAVNNLSDALSSVITIVGTKLAGRRPDREHPLGHGRIEYLSAMIVSGLVLYAGIASLVESVKKIIRPEKPDYSVLSLVIIASAVLVKIALGRYVSAQGKKKPIRRRFPRRGRTPCSTRCFPRRSWPRRWFSCSAASPRRRTSAR